MSRAKIDHIKDLMRDGIVNRNAAMAKFGEKWQNTKNRTFDRHWSTAKDEFNDELRANEAIREQTRTETLQGEIAANIATESELDLVLSKIAMGGCRVQEFIKGEAIIRDVTPTEIIMAADKLYKRKGSYSPTKIANTDSEGKDIAQLNIIAPVGLKLEFPNNTDGADA
jgi:hypothetical protein